jgi:hypothetical protein
MDELLKLLEPLDWSRQASWNLGRGASDLMEGNAPSLKDVLPGLLGAGLTGGLATTGVGIPASILLGSLLAGANQWVYGNAAATPASVIQKIGIDPESTEGMLGGVGLAALTDPLTFGATGAGIQGIKRLARGRSTPAIKTASMTDNAADLPFT